MVFPEFCDQVLHGSRVDAESGLTGLNRQCHCQMGFTDSGGPKEDNILPVLDKCQIKQRHHLLLVEFWLKNKIKFITEQLHDKRYKVNAKNIAVKLLEYADKLDVTPAEA